MSARLPSLRRRTAEAFELGRLGLSQQSVISSFGAAQLRAGEDGDALLDRANAAPYRANAEGRNRVARD